METGKHRAGKGLIVMPRPSAGAEEGGVELIGESDAG